MAFFSFAYRQMHKGFGKTVLFSLLLAFITTISIIVVIAKGLSQLSSKQFLDEYEQKYNCEIKNYELTCKENVYEFGDYKIDLTYEGEELEFGYSAIFTKTHIISTNYNAISYEALLTNMENPNANQNVDIYDGIKFLNRLSPIIYILVFIGCMIGLSIAYPIGNLLLSLVIWALINSQFKTKYKYQSIYKLTIVTTLPYILFNAITRIILNKTITEFIPFGLLGVVIDYAVIYGITYFTVKEGIKNEPVITNTEGPIIEVNPNQE